MSRCKHLGCTISEVLEADRHYHFVDGHMYSYSSKHRPPSGYVFVRCGCGLERAYSIGAWPKWLRERMRAIPEQLREGLSNVRNE